MSDDVPLTWDQRDTLETLGLAAARGEPAVREWTRPRTVRPASGRIARVRREIAEQLEERELAALDDAEGRRTWRATDRGLELLELRRKERR